jgi:hypothetical protein
MNERVKKVMGNVKEDMARTAEIIATIMPVAMENGFTVEEVATAMRFGIVEKYKHELRNERDGKNSLEESKIMSEKLGAMLFDHLGEKVSAASIMRAIMALEMTTSALQSIVNTIQKESPCCKGKEVKDCANCEHGGIDFDRLKADFSSGKVKEEHLAVLVFEGEVTVSEINTYFHQDVANKVLALATEMLQEEKSRKSNLSDKAKAEMEEMSNIANGPIMSYHEFRDKMKDFSPEAIEAMAENSAMKIVKVAGKDLDGFLDNVLPKEVADVIRKELKSKAFKKDLN